MSGIENGCIRTEALLKSDVFCTHRTQRNKSSHYHRTCWSQSHRTGPDQDVSGVGTSRSALLLTVRVESGIARTKSNNGPRSWLCSFLLTLCCCNTQILYHVNAHVWLRCSFTFFSVATHYCVAGVGGRGTSGRRRRKKPLTGMAISTKTVAFFACTMIAARCVHAVLSTRLLLTTFIHVWQRRKTKN